ncbi:MAG TPA: nitroreductase family protein, partial [Clostridia bacterium]|nr:nitroreductase family protein [Clostridia bacterium]
MESSAAARDLFAVLKKRATCRNFRPDPIPDEVMERLLEAACTSASSGGFQRVSVVVVTGETKKKRLAELSRNQDFIAKAPANFVFCVDHRRMRRIAEYEDAPCPTEDSLATLWMGVVDATIAAQSMALAAETMGLRSCYNGNIVDMPLQMTELISLPHGVVPAIMLTVGYPAAKSAQSSRKYAPHVMVHAEEYSDLP